MVRASPFVWSGLFYVIVRRVCYRRVSWVKRIAAQKKIMLIKIELPISFLQKKKRRMDDIVSRVISLYCVANIDTHHQHVVVVHANIL